ncbi:hypothetical protein KIH39_16120 [Telmatocola sphagniphila]|uniref:Uncharacterized protein n=1 Tax=Telmatocola sphagniphila TaxID=1123043 RepID=A0A8E6B1M6_9BACT|nr:hypothetical protein [Telmatocola sphagniphila]QVL30375.1 hypothetical protein KIH39_16120 [Telmatocola sphagniphila]
MTRRKIKRWILIGSFLLLLSLIAGVLFLIFNNDLERLQAQLDLEDPGWRFEQLIEQRNAYKPEPNSFSVIEELILKHPAAIAALVKSPDIENLRLLPEKLPKQLDEWLTKELAKDPAAVELARKLVKYPQGKHSLEYDQNWLKTDLSGLQKCRGIAQLLRWDALHQAQNQKWDTAVLDIRAIFNAGRSVEGELSLLANLIQMALDNIAIRTTQDILSQGVLPEILLRDLQRELERQTNQNLVLSGFRGERAAFLEFTNLLRRDPDQLMGFNASIHPLQRTLMQITWSSDQAMGLKICTEMVKAAMLPPYEALEKFKEIERDFPTIVRSWRHPLTRNLMASGLRIFEAECNRRAFAGSSLIAVACERYRLAKGQWPDQLQEICPEYLETLPLDPFSGKPMLYQRLSDGIAIYSVGKNRIDDQGDLIRQELPEPRSWSLDAQDFGEAYQPKDTGIRLWDPANRAKKAAILQDVPGEK